LLIEFADVKLKEGLSPHDAIMEAGKARMTPVILTAIAAILGLIPLAVGLNIDFANYLPNLIPHIFFGGDSVSFLGSTFLDYDIWIVLWNHIDLDSCSCIFLDFIGKRKEMV
jgi:hypothetical protein